MDLVDDEDAEMPLVSRSSSSSTIHGTDTTNAASAADEATPQKKKDGRGRPPSTGEYIGVGRARMEMKRKKEAAEEVWRRRLLASEEQHLDEEEEGRAAAGSKRAKRHTRRDFLKDGPERRKPIGDITTAQVVERITEALEAVGNVAAKSGNLKGGYVKALKDSVATIKEAAEEVKERAERDDEMVRISRQLARARGENKRLSAELQELRIELAGLTANYGAPSSRGKPPLQAQESGDPAGMVTREELTRTIGEAINSLSSKLAEEIRRGVGAEVASRFDVLMPVSRPPLAADNRRLSATNRRPQTEGESEPGREGGKNRPSLPAAPSRKTTRGGEPPAKQKAPPRKEVPSAPVTRPPAPSSSPTETWTQVVGRKKKNKEKQKEEAKKAPPVKPPPPSQQQQTRQDKGGGKKKQTPPKKRAGRVPKTAAVTVTVPEGGSLNMGEVMARARGAIDLRELGIPNLKPRRAITGGLILEIPGEDGVEKADKLAEAMSALFAEGEARVSRPVKTAEIRVKGLDDSVSADEVAAALATAGGCARGEVS